MRRRMECLPLVLEEPARRVTVQMLDSENTVRK